MEPEEDTQKEAGPGEPWQGLGGLVIHTDLPKGTFLLGFIFF